MVFYQLGFIERSITKSISPKTHNERKMLNIVGKPTNKPHKIIFRLLRFYNQVCIVLSIQSRTLFLLS